MFSFFNSSVYLVGVRYSVGGIVLRWRDFGFGVLRFFFRGYLFSENDVSNISVW